MSIPWLGWSKAPPSLADAFMRDPVGALSPRRPTAAELQRTARRFLADTNVCGWRARVAPGCCCSTRRTGTRRAARPRRTCTGRRAPPRSTRGATATPTPSSTRRRRCWSSARRDAPVSGGVGRGDGARAVFEARAAPRPRARRRLCAAHVSGRRRRHRGAVPDARARRSARRRAVVAVRARRRRRRRPGRPPHAVGRAGGQGAVLRPVPRGRRGRSAPRGRSTCSSRRSPTSGTARSRWCAACAARAATRPIHGWADDCALNSGVVLAGTCAGARRLLRPGSAWRPSARRSARAPPSSASRASATARRRRPSGRRSTTARARCAARTGTRSTRCSRGRTSAEAIVVDDRLVNRPDAQRAPPVVRRVRRPRRLRAEARAPHPRVVRRAARRRGAPGDDCAARRAVAPEAGGSGDA